MVEEPCKAGFRCCARGKKLLGTVRSSNTNATNCPKCHSSLRLDTSEEKNGKMLFWRSQVEVNSVYTYSLPISSFHSSSSPSFWYNSRLLCAHRAFSTEAAISSPIFFSYLLRSLLWNCGHITGLLAGLCFFPLYCVQFLLTERTGNYTSVRQWPFILQWLTALLCSSSP